MLHIKHTLLRHPLLLITLTVLLLLIAIVRSVHAVSSIEDLWIDMRIGPPLIQLFNDSAQPDDIARIDRPEQIDQLRGIEAGRKLVIFRSIAEIEQSLPEIADQIDMVGYNIEHGPATPQDEQADPVTTVKRVRDLVDKYDLELAVGPDQDFAMSHGLELAPYADIFVLQVQRQQTNAVLVQEYVSSLAPQLRSANPGLQISVQVRTEGDTDALVELLDSMKADLDGVSILTSPDTVDVAEELVADLRSSSSRNWLVPISLVLLLSVVSVVAVFIIHRRRLGR